MKEIAYVYQHRRLDTNEVFYVGIGSQKNFKRAYTRYGRNFWWYKIVKKANYSVDILYKNLSWEQACKYEINLIAMYGRKDLKLGELVNHTAGGDGCTGLRHSVEDLIKMSIAQKGKLLSEEHKNNIRIAKNKSKQSQNVKDKISTAHKKWILNTETGIYYHGTKEASEIYNINNATLKDWLLGRSKNKSNLIYC